MTDHVTDVIGLQVENFRRVKLVQIRPGVGVTELKGKNRQGKTSFLDAVAWAIGGAEFGCAEPVHHGAEKAKVVVETADFTITRTQTAAGTMQLLVTDPKSGAKYPSPQALLDRLKAKRMLDPVAFMNETPEKQLKMVRDLVGLDFSKLDARRKECYDLRTSVNRDIKAYETRVAAAPHYPDAPAVEEVMDALHDEVIRRRESNRLKSQAATLIEMKRTKVEFANSQILAQEGTIAELEAELVRAKEQLATLQQTRENHEKAVQEAITAHEALPDANEQESIGRMSTIDAVNRKVRANDERAKIEKSLASVQAKAKELSDEIDGIDLAKSQQLAGAKFPVEGLGFAENGVTYKNLPLSQASAAELLSISMAMAYAMGPDLNLILIRNGSLMDSEEMTRVEAFAQEHKLKILVERVCDGEGVGIIIEDGEIKAATEKEVPSETAPPATGGIGTPPKSLFGGR